MFYFKLISKKSSKAVDLDYVDKEIYNLLGYAHDDTKWCKLTSIFINGVDWYNIIGLALSLGDTYDKIERDFVHSTNKSEFEDNIYKVIEYLKSNYDVDNGYYIK